MSRNIRNGNSEHIRTANQTSRSKTIIWRWRSKTSGAQDTLSNPWCGVIWCDTIVTFSRLNVKENQLSSMLLPDSSLVLGVQSYWVFEVPVHTKHGWTSFHLRNVTPHLKHSVDICQHPPCCHATPRPNGLQAPGESTCNDWMSFRSFGGACYNVRAEPWQLHLKRHSVIRLHKQANLSWSQAEILLELWK